MGVSSMPLDPLFPFKRLLNIIHWRGAFMRKYMYTAVQSSSDHTRWSTIFYIMTWPFTEIQAVEPLLYLYVPSCSLISVDVVSQSGVECKVETQSVSKPTSFLGKPKRPNYHM